MNKRLNVRTLLAALLLCGGAISGSGAPGDKTLFSSAPANGDSARVRFRLVEKTLRPKIVFKFGSGEQKTVLLAAKDVVMDAIYVEYKQRGAWEKANGPVPKKTYANIAVTFDGLGLDWYCRPNPAYYDIPVPPETLLRWEKAFPDALATDMTLEARREGDDVAYYVNGQYAGRTKGAKSVRSVTIRDFVPAAKFDVGLDDLTLEDRGPSFKTEWFAARPPSARVTLPSRGRAHALPLLADGKAKLSLKSGLQTVGGVEMNVLPPEESVDISLHRATSHQTSLFGNPYFERSAYHPCPEFSQWCVPNAFYATAWVLCADVPRPGHEPYVGVQLTRFGDQGSSGMAVGRQTLDGAPEVGTLEWTEKGVRKTSPLKLVRVEIELGRILEYVNDKAIYADGIGWKKLHKLHRVLPQVDDYLDFEFDGGGTWKTPSSAQVFGVTLEKSPYGVEMVQSEFGNLFYNDEKPETGVELTALADGTKGFVDAVVYDEAFRVLATNTQPFAIAKAGGKTVLTFDLAQRELGWYGLDFVFRDARGERLFAHEAAFALLGKDTREAGYDSPFAAWPHNGRHNSQPHLEEVAKKMHKMGLRKSWEPPGRGEDEPHMRKYSITKSVLLCANPCRPCTAEMLAAELDARVAEGRESLAKFPHMSRTIQLLHEQGGRELASEMLYQPAVRGEYKGIEGPWDVYYCTEFCKRMRKEFPDFDIQIGNGSSASAKIAGLCSGGFDLGLVTQLGIESKGFGTMPEECANLEAPGMLWALRETGRRFGYTNFTMNACNEYVFRPERTVDETWSKARRMQVTDFTLRDYLISLAWGCRTISTGHPEDCFTAYYESNWGAGGQCKFYPYTYPKRMFTALANFTKVFDKAKFTRRVPTGEISTYALEFRRDRRVKDYATAFWTPQHGVELRLELEKDGAYRWIDWQGREHPLKGGRLTAGSTPTYVVSDRPISKATVLRHFQDDLGTDRRTVLATCAGGRAKGVELAKPGDWPITRGDYGGIGATVGKWAFASVRDPEAGDVLEAKLLPNGDPKFPELGPEHGKIELVGGQEIPAGWNGRLGVMVKGNGSFGRVALELRDRNGRGGLVRLGYRGHACFNGWAVMTVEAKHTEIAKFPDRIYRPTAIWFSTTANALDPIELRPNPEPLRFKDVVLLPPEDVSKTYELDAGRSAEVMKLVPEKDL